MLFTLFAEWNSFFNNLPDQYIIYFKESLVGMDLRDKKV